MDLKQNRASHSLGHFRFGVTTNAEALQGPVRVAPVKSSTTPLTRHTHLKNRRALTLTPLGLSA